MWFLQVTIASSQYIGSEAAVILPVFLPVESFDRMVNAIISQLPVRYALNLLCRQIWIVLLAPIYRGEDSQKYTKH